MWCSSFVLSFIQTNIGHVLSYFVCINITQQANWSLLLPSLVNVRLTRFLFIITPTFIDAILSSSTKSKQDNTSTCARYGLTIYLVTIKTLSVRRPAEIQWKSPVLFPNLSLLKIIHWPYSDIHATRKNQRTRIFQFVLESFFTFLAYLSIRLLAVARWWHGADKQLVQEYLSHLSTEQKFIFIRNWLRAFCSVGSNLTRFVPYLSVLNRLCEFYESL